MAAGVTVRRITDGDFVAVSSLLAQLGRPAVTAGTEAATREVFGRIVADADAYPMLAEVDGVPVGFCSLHFRERFNHPTREAWVPDLIVSEATRGTGAGKALLQAAIAEARQRGCHNLTLESGYIRQVAHRFYAMQGMTDAGKFFTIQLAPEGGE